jgi:MFS family permease
MRRLLPLVSAIVLVDVMFFAAITPLLPYYAERLELSKSAAGLLAAAYPAGTLIFSLPAGWVAARVGVRPVVLGGLLLMATASIAFGFAESGALLGVARFLQGVGSAFSWAGGLAWLVAAAPPERRGQVIGTAFGAAVAGGLMGPVLGAAARAAGPAPVFACVAALNLALAVTAALTPAPRRARAEGGVREALRERRTLVGAALIVLVGVFFGVVDVLAPLRLDELGAGNLVIGATFLTAGALSALTSPLYGRWVDRGGGARAIQAGLVAGALFAALLPWPEAIGLLAVIVIAASPAVGILWVPGMTLLSQGTERRGVEQAYAFALLNLTWAAAALAGSAVGSALADATRDAVPYSILGALFLASALYSLSRRAPQRRALP